VKAATKVTQRHDGTESVSVTAQAEKISRQPDAEFAAGDAHGQQAAQIVIGAADGDVLERAWWQRGALKHHHFRNVFIASFGSNIGTWMEHVGVRWVMSQATLAAAWTSTGKPGAPIMMGYLTVAAMAPMVIFGPIGGVVADRANRKRMLVVTQGMLMVIAALLAIFSYLQALSPWLLLTLSFLNGIVYVFNVPAWQVLIPRLVPREDLTEAITLNGIQFNLARVIGPAIAGFMMGLWGPTVLFLINTASFLGVLTAISTTPPTPRPEKVDAHPWDQFMEACRFLLHAKGPRTCIVYIVVFSMLTTPVLAMLPIVVSEVYHKEESSFGILLGMLGAGAVIAGLTMRRVMKTVSRQWFVPISIVGGAITLGAVAASPNMYFCAPSMLALGVFWSWCFNASFSGLQLLVEDRMRGRVLSICNMLSFGAMPLGALLCGWIGEAVSVKNGDGIGTQFGLGVLALALLIFGIWSLQRRVPEVDGDTPAGGTSSGPAEAN
jgi:MFS family permease